MASPTPVASRKDARPTSQTRTGKGTFLLSPSPAPYQLILGRPVRFLLDRLIDDDDDIVNALILPPSLDNEDLCAALPVFLAASDDASSLALLTASLSPLLTLIISQG
eukprot:CAMPEP_0113559538 /NCGR_PEP_ID=MMETSP0015_2-20120614/18951_1 /TAXON_ID=2838 /ORGANISM="Odontella" /LENGTH=107 /DNA_ID=CAMNT_0000461183 /DNA_START=511 /DNA_END=834 /DNA_ORIENTATION=- /assembly_acc=CAM_ASM_000160